MSVDQSLLLNPPVQRTGSYVLETRFSKKTNGKNALPVGLTDKLTNTAGRLDWMTRVSPAKVTARMTADCRAPSRGLKTNDPKRYFLIQKYFDKKNQTDETLNVPMKTLCLKHFTFRSISS